jgi:Protein of unknown function (DUF3604)
MRSFLKRDLISSSPFLRKAVPAAKISAVARAAGLRMHRAPTASKEVTPSAVPTAVRTRSVSTTNNATTPTVRTKGNPDVLKYAQGQTIKHPLGYDIKIDTPMDFMGVTDHSEYVGVTKEANTPGSALSKLPVAQPLILKGMWEITPEKSASVY